MKNSKFGMLAFTILFSLVARAAHTNATGSDPDVIGKYFQDTPNTLAEVTEDNAYFAIVAAFHSEDEANAYVSETTAANKDIALAVFRPYSKNYTVMIAANVSSQVAMEACRLAKTKGIHKNMTPIQWRYPHQKKPC
jgi:hypothetical protein